ncbi:hypothetical protein B0J17DRAFT_411355 [Rhizoctonia solani]|nr:hypothetical protein B0J17DRAFT_411355 [Rhizoctonia solani]
MDQGNVPGPVVKSCLTCKQRHKKCNQRRPICTSCEAGGVECLGYSHNRTTLGSVLPGLPEPQPNIVHNEQGHPRHDKDKTETAFSAGNNGRKWKYSHFSFLTTIILF